MPDKLNDSVIVWTMRLKKGDVVRSPSGMLRIVRAVSPGCTPRKTWLYFTIQRCSWTRACYTLYNAAEIYYLGWEAVATKPFALNTKFDKLIEADFDKHGNERRFHCCDVRGVA